MTQQQLTAQEKLEAIKRQQEELKRQERELKRLAAGAVVRWNKDGTLFVIENVTSGWPISIKPQDLATLAEHMPSIMAQARALVQEH